MSDQHHDSLNSLTTLPGGQLHPKFGHNQVVVRDDNGTFKTYDGKFEIKDGAWAESPRETLTPEEAEKYLHDKFILESEIDQLRRQMEAKVKQKKSALNGLNDKYEKRLEATIRDRQAQSGQKTFHFDYATCRIKKDKGGIKIVDEAAAIIYAKRYLKGRCLSYVLQKDDYKRLVEHYAKNNNGELLPGTDIEPEKLTFSIGKPKSAPVEMEEEE